MRHLGAKPSAGLTAWWRGLPEGRRSLIQAGGVLAAAVLVWLLYYVRQRFVAVSDPDAEDYAQIALQIFHGKGLSSATMPLCGLEYLRLRGLDPTGGGIWPNLHRFPLMSWVEAGFFHLLGPSDRALSVSSGVFYAATLPLLFLFGKRYFGLAAATLATFVYMLSPGALGESISGLTEPATTFFLVAVISLLTGPRRRPAIALAGVLWGLSFWNRYTGAMLALPFSIYLWAQDRKRAPGNLAAFLLPMALAMAPEMLRNLRTAGDPLFSLTATLMAPYRSHVAPTTHWWYVPVYVKPSDILLAWPGAMLHKWWLELYGGWRYLPLQGGMAALYPFLVLSLFMRAENDLQRRLRILLVALVAMHEMTLPFLSNILRYYAYLVPLMLLFSCWTLVALLRRALTLFRPEALLGAPGPEGIHISPRTLAAGAVLAASVAPVAVGWMKLDGPRPHLNADSAWVDTSRAHMDAVRAAVKENELVLTEAPWSIAWRADRRAVPLPSGPALVPFLIREYGLDAAAILLLPRHVDAIESINWRQWEEVRQGKRSVPGFRVATRFRDGAVLLTRQ